MSNAAQAVKRKLVVCGGNGFLGSRICKSAVGRGWNVVSLSRSGEPKWQNVTSSPTAPEWSKSVTWHSANVLHPSAYTSLLEGADAVVHSMGILLEADYKGLVRGQDGLVAGLSRMFASTRGGANQNPLEQKSGEDVEPAEPNGPITYELMNRDSAILLAREASAHKVPSFVYISASSAPPILPSRYMSSKRAAETNIARAFPNMRSLFFRPGFLYDSSRGFTIPIAAATRVVAGINSGIFGGKLTWLTGAGGENPTKADDVAAAVVEAIDDEGVKGVVDIKQIEGLANRAWRKGML